MFVTQPPPPLTSQSELSCSVKLLARSQPEQYSILMWLNSGVEYWKATSLTSTVIINWCCFYFNLFSGKIRGQLSILQAIPIPVGNVSRLPVPVECNCLTMTYSEGCQVCLCGLLFAQYPDPPLTHCS